MWRILDERITECEILKRKGAGIEVRFIQNKPFQLNLLLVVNWHGVPLLAGLVQPQKTRKTRVNLLHFVTHFLTMSNEYLLSGSPAKSSSLDFGNKNDFPSFLPVKRVWQIYLKKQFIIFQFLMFALLRPKIKFWPS